MKKMSLIVLTLCLAFASCSSQPNVRHSASWGDYPPSAPSSFDDDDDDDNSSSSSGGGSYSGSFGGSSFDFDD